MANIYLSRGKRYNLEDKMKMTETASERIRIRRRMREIAVATLQDQGWTVQKMPGMGKSSLRRLVRGDEEKFVALKTTRDTWIAFPRNSADDGWETLSDVESVVVASVDDPENPKAALVHTIPADEMRDRFDRAYKARLAAGYQIQQGRGIWVSLYREDAMEPVVNVGAGAGIAHPPLARVPLDPTEPMSDTAADSAKHLSVSSSGVTVPPAPAGGLSGAEQPLTIADAKRRLAATLGVAASSIKITVEA